MARRHCYEDVLPCIAMVAVECSNVNMDVLFKAASSKGLSHISYITYSFALATLVLLPLTFFLISKTELSPFKFPLISRLCPLGLAGFRTWHSDSFLCHEQPLPAFTFILALFFRMEKVALRSSNTQAKIIASIYGACVVVLYKGPKVFYSPHWTSSAALLLQQSPESPQSNWVISGLLLALGYLFYSFRYVVQSQVVKMYPEEMIVTFIYNLSLVILTVPVSLLAEPNMSSWRLRPSIVAASVLYSGIFATSCFTGLHAWGVRLKGPVYVATFRPLSIVIAAVTRAIFLSDASYLRGIDLISWALCCTMGKAKEEELTCDDSASSSSEPFSSCKVSLLQSHGDEQI